MTNWHVITGAPCSGKTAVIKKLAGRGYPVVHETARAHIDSQLALGLTLHEIKSDILSFQRHILLEKVRIEQGLPKTETIFLDRAVPDSMAYFQLEGLNGEEVLKYSTSARYRRVFLLDQLEFESDGVRSEDHVVACRIEALLDQCYRQLGYAIIRVPVMPIDQRTDYILDHIHS